jgi:Flp pilus assembly protein TadB
MKALKWLRARYRWWMLSIACCCVLLAGVIHAGFLPNVTAVLFGYLLGELMWRTSYDREKELSDEAFAALAEHHAWVESMADLIRSAEAAAEAKRAGQAP